MEPKKSKLYKPKQLTGVKKFQGRETQTAAKKYKAWYNDPKWKRYCYRFLHHNPLCYACGRKATEVDHAVAHKGDEKLFWCVTNYLPLCKPCHSTCTSRFDRYNPPKVEDKSKWLIRARELRHNFIRVKVVPFKD